MEKNKKIKKILCPVCERFYFEPLTDDEIDSDDSFCTVCGWNYDENQINNYNLKTEVNSKSINEYREWFSQQIAANPKYNFLDSQKQKGDSHLCPICGKHKFKEEFSYEICPYCGWEDDGCDESDPDDFIGANGMTVQEYRNNYFKLIKNNPTYKWKK